LRASFVNSNASSYGLLICTSNPISEDIHTPP
jgi:hypothetical protein